MPSSPNNHLANVVQLLDVVLQSANNFTAASSVNSTSRTAGFFRNTLSSPSSSSSSGGGSLSHNAVRLPYKDDVKCTIRSQIICLIREFPLLNVFPSTYTYDDGRSVEILELEGTIPMYHRGIKYNLPIKIYLPQNFPRSAPMIFVVPNRDMTINVSHPHVGASGELSLPDLQSWKYPKSNLLDTVSTLSVICGENPPLYTRQTELRPSQFPSAAAAAASVVAAAAGRSPSPASPPSLSASPSSFPLSPRCATPSHCSPSAQRHVRASPRRDGSGNGGEGRTDSVGGSLSPPRASSVYPPVRVQSAGFSDSSAYGRSTGGSLSPHRTEAVHDASLEELQQSAILSLSEKLDQDVATTESKLAHEQEESVNVQTLLESRCSEIENGLEALRREKSSLEERLQTVRVGCDVLEQWLSENDDDVDESGDEEEEERGTRRIAGIGNGNLGASAAAASSDGSRGRRFRTRRREDLEIDDVFEPEDARSKVLLEAVAEDLAIEDLLYCLDDAVRAGVVSVENYLRYTRGLARDQFYQRAIAIKTRWAMEESKTTLSFLSGSAVPPFVV